MSRIKDINSTKHAAEDLMVELLLKIVKDLKLKVEQGEASSQDIRNAISLLKDNNVTVAIDKGETLDFIKRTKDTSLPFHGDHLEVVSNDN